jgi:hypothetical protein
MVYGNFIFATIADGQIKKSQANLELMLSFPNTAL